MHIALKRYRQAILCFDKALQADKYSFEAAYHKSQSLVQVGRHTQAISLLRKIVKSNKVHPHQHGKPHMSIKNKILKDKYLTKLQNDKGFLSFISNLP